MRKYLQIAVMNWELRMVFRMNNFLEASGNIATTLVTIALWLFAFNRTGSGSIGGYTQAEMITYLLIAGVITSTLWYTSQGDRVISGIRQGTITKYLTRPMSFTTSHFIAQTVGNAFRFVFSILIVFAIGLLVKSYLHFSFTFSWRNVLLFVIFMILAILIQFLVIYTAALLAFWMDEVWGITFLLRVFSEIAAGTFLPLSLFSPIWQKIFDFLPFKYIVSIPVNVLLGKLALDEIVRALVISAVWLLGMFLLMRFTWQRGLRQYSAVGG